MAQLLVLTSTAPGDVLPSLGLLSHRIRHVPAEAAQLVNAPQSDLMFVDARTDLVSAKALCKILASSGSTTPIVLVVTEGGLTAVNSDWNVDDVVLESAGPAEIDARIRLSAGRAAKGQTSLEDPGVRCRHRRGQLLGQGARPAARPDVQGVRALRFFATHPSRVFTREQLLSEVWGYDYFGGTRTVDVHVRRLRAKLGDLESLIGTVRNVGYRFNVYDDEAERLMGQ